MVILTSDQCLLKQEPENDKLKQQQKLNIDCYSCLSDNPKVH